MMGPKKDFDERFEDDVQEEKDRKHKVDDKYGTCRLREERASKDEKNRSGNKSTEDDDSWS